MAKAACIGCGRTFYRKTGTHKFCTTACREHHRALDDPARRQRYSSPHQRLRALVAVAVEQGRASCARCGLPIAPGEPFDLDHADDGNGYLGPSHARCNRATTRPASRSRDELRWSRRWLETAPEGTLVLGKEIRRGGAWVPLEAA
jgi:hypothetical protein